VSLCMEGLFGANTSTDLSKGWYDLCYELDLQWLIFLRRMCQWGNEGRLVLRDTAKWLMGVFRKSLFGTTQTPRICWMLSYHSKFSPFEMAPLRSPPHHSPSTQPAFGRRTKTNVLWASLFRKDLWHGGYGRVAVIPSANIRRAKSD
jgi:hypothetical protein